MPNAASYSINSRLPTAFNRLVYMNSDLPAPSLSNPLASLPDDSGSVPAPAPEAGPAIPQVRLKGENGRLLLLIPPETDVPSLGITWTDIWQQLKNRLSAGDRFWQPQTPVHLMARDRLFDTRQLQELTEILESAQLRLQRVQTTRRQTAVAAVTVGLSVDQQPPIAPFTQTTDVGQALAEPLYIQTTVRSGMEVRHPGTVVVLGDVNPGSAIVADGDVMVWGTLRGVVQAGAGGNSRCMIMALRLEPTQIRIADFVARAPETPPSQYHPEVAYVAPEGIRIVKAADFSRDKLFPA